MRGIRCTATGVLAAMLAWLAVPVAAPAREFGEDWSVDLLLAGGLQCPVAGRNASSCGAAAPLQAEIRFEPTASHVLAVKLGFAAGNGLDADSPFDVSLWAADLGDGVRDVNGSGRDHLLTAWYRFATDIAGNDRLQVTAGIIDGTDYLDGNAFANDEFTQFMNGALVNAPNGFVPSYEPGVAIVWDSGAWSWRGVYMRTSPNELGNRSHYFGGEAGLTLHNRLGRATARLVLQQTSRDFAAADLSGRAALRTWLVSADQEIGEALGLWARFGSQDDEAAVFFRSLYSGGASLRGRSWNRANDQVGMGLAFLHGGNLGVDAARVVEAYYRAEVHRRLAATLDLQYVRQSWCDGTSESAWVAGLRLVLRY